MSVQDFILNMEYAAAILYGNITQMPFDDYLRIRKIQSRLNLNFEQAEALYKEIKKDEQG